MPKDNTTRPAVPKKLAFLMRGPPSRLDPDRAGSEPVRRNEHSESAGTLATGHVTARVGHQAPKAARRGRGANYGPGRVRLSIVSNKTWPTISLLVRDGLWQARSRDKRSLATSSLQSSGALTWREQ